ncbi:MAG: hypothetical protein RL235_68, partial [Chlamydiota bacterium]
FVTQHNIPLRREAQIDAAGTAIPDTEDPNGQHRYVAIVAQTATATIEELEEPKRRALILQYRPQTVLDGLAPEQIKALHQDCLVLHTRVLRIEQTLKQLVTKAKLPEDTQDFYNISLMCHEGSIILQPADDSVRNVGLGYTFYLLLRQAKILQETAKWNGELAFTLTEADLLKLEQSLATVTKWSRDFDIAMADALTAGNPDGAAPESSYARTAWKQANEVWNSCANFTTLNGRNQFNKLLGGAPVLMLTDMCIDLRAHPDEARLKRAIEVLYATPAKPLKSTDGKSKRCVIGTSFSLIGPAQLKQVVLHLNRFIEYKKFICALTGKALISEAEFAVQHDPARYRVTLGGDKVETAVVKKMLCEKADRTIGALGKDFRGNIQNVHAAIQRTVPTPFDPAFAHLIAGTDESQALPTHEKEIMGRLAGANLSAVYDAYDKAICQEMDDWTIVAFPTITPDFTPTEADITRLYRDSGPAARKHYYALQAGLTEDFRDVGALFRSLKECDAVRAIAQNNPRVLADIDVLSNALETRIRDKYPGNPERGWPSSREQMRETIRLLEMAVATVVYQVRSRVEQTSVEYAMTQLQMLADGIHELIGGCDQGLNGRLYSFSAALTSTRFADLKRNALQHARDKVDLIRIRICGAESADGVSDALDVQRVLNIQPPHVDNGARRANALQLDGPRIRKEFLKEYTVSQLIDFAKLFLNNEFWLLTQEAQTEENDARIYAFLEEIGLSSDHAELDRRFRVRGDRAQPFQYALIEAVIPEQLPIYLYRQGLITTSQTKATATHAAYWNGRENKRETVEIQAAQPQHRVWHQPLAAAQPAHHHRDYDHEALNAHYGYYPQAAPVAYGG